MKHWHEVVNSLKNPTDILCVRQLFTPDECEAIILACENYGEWAVYEGDAKTGNAPGKEIRISKASKPLASMVRERIVDEVFPIIRLFWQRARPSPKKFREPFIVKYSHKVGQLEMDVHTDSSAITVSGPFGGDFGGGGLYFPRHGVNSNDHLDVGDVFVWPGDSFQYPHKAEPITDGIRYSFTQWIRDYRDEDTHDLMEPWPKEA